MKKFTHSLMRGIATAFCLMTVSLALAANITVDGINYSTKAATTTTPATATIAKYTAGSPYSGDIVIPEVITYEGVDYTVVATAANSFLECVDLTSVVLPNTCVTIARNTFKGCTGLTQSPIPPTVTSVGNGVFYGCSGLKEVTITSGWGKVISEQFTGCSLEKIIFADGAPIEISSEAFGKIDSTPDAVLSPKTVEEIYFGCNIESSNYANNKQPFHNFTGLKKITFSGNATTINNTMFQGCTALTDIMFAEGCQISTIGANAFQSCTALASFTFPEAVTTVESSVFNGCKNLTSVTFSPATTSIGISAFYNSGLTSLTLPASLTSIGSTAFTNSKIEGTVVFPEGLTSIGSQAFANTPISGIELPSTVTSIGSAAFGPTPNLTSIVLNEGNTAFKLNEGVLTNMAETRLLITALRTMPTSKDDASNALNNATIETIDNYGLSYATFEAVELPALTTIGDYGFAYSALKSFNLKNNVQVGLNVFSNSALETLVIEEGRNEITQGLAANCENLSSVTLPSSTTNMMKDCFANCPALEEMEIQLNTNYMEMGSVPATIQRLRVLNPKVPALAADVFNAEQGEVICKVATNSVEDFKADPQWGYLNIVGDATIPSTGAALGCPTGLYFATSDGKLMYRDEEGNIIDTEFNAGAHAFTLANYKNRIYVADAGEKFTYQDPNQPLGDGQLFYVNKTNDIFYRVTVLNNVGFAPSEDPFTMFIDSLENIIYISDRNVGIHQMSADATGLYGQQPFFMQNQWLPYYNDEISWGSITGGFTRDSHGIFWMSKKFNGLALLRFTTSDLYPDGGQGHTKHYNALFKDAIIKTFFLDEKNGYLWMHVQKDAVSHAVPGIYRIALSRIEKADGSDAEGNAELKISDCQLIDDSPIRSSGSSFESSGEIDCIAQIYGDGTNIYWGYIAPVDDGHAIAGSTALDPSNPLHHSGIKTCKAADENPTVTFAVENVEAYGITGATFIPEEEPIIPGDVDGNGKVNVSDVTTLVNMILGVVPKDLERADVDGNGQINVSDVTALVNIILGVI